MYEWFPLAVKEFSGRHKNKWNTMFNNNKIVKAQLDVEIFCLEEIISRC